MDGFAIGRIQRLKIAVTMLIVFTTIVIAPLSGNCAPAPSQDQTQLSLSEKEALVNNAVSLYEQGKFDKSREELERSAAAFPENYAVPYYLGLICMEYGDRQGAIAHWQRYLKMAPQTENAMKIRKTVTLLLRQEAKEFAQLAVTREALLDSGPANDNTIAVTSFGNLGSENLGPLGKGMAAMLITDLSSVPDLEVVDRIKLQALLEEMKMGTSGLVKMETAPRVGKLLKAKHVTSGTLADVEEENLTIASALVDTDQKASIGSQEAQGVLKRFYDLEKQIACQVIEDLGRDCKAMPGAFNKIHTQSLPALTWYSKGLDAFDEENYDEAREMFQKAVEEDPEFDLAVSALLSTPTSTMASMSTAQMVSNASAGGPSSTVAGTAVITTSGTTGSTIAATSATAGGVGFPPMTAIAAGVAAVGGGVALASGGGDSDGGGGGDPPPPPPNLTGDWKGSWEDLLGVSGNAEFSLTQTGDTVSGTVLINSTPCLTTGDVTGTLSGSTVNLNITSGGEAIELSATHDNSAKTISGTWTYSASEAGCTGDRGNFSTTLTTGSGKIDW